jgi:hypothetical protein
MKINIHLKKEYYEDQEAYAKLPEDVRKVYISVLQNIPMDHTEMREIVKANPDYFHTVQAKSFGQLFKRMQNVKTARQKQRKKLMNVVSRKKRKITNVQYVTADQVEFPKS